jgi:hydrogenase large subunit
MDMVHEAGPLARMWVNGNYTNGISVLDRLAARALEAQKVAVAMDSWLDELSPGESVFKYTKTPENASGIGLTEAPRGALGHWIEIKSSKIDRYQIVTPTNWNASPKDDLEQYGAIEQALIGTPVADIEQPIEVLRVVHSFDPCLACAVHMLRPDEDKARTIVHTRPSI